MDLQTTYLGLDLKNPIVPSSSPLCRNIGSLKRMEDSGAAAVVLHSLFEEAALATLDDIRPGTEEFVGTPAGYLEHLRQAKEALDIPVIASLNGYSGAGWTELASQLEAAGADALELNVYYLPVDPAVTSADVEKRHLEILELVLSSVKIPVAMKLSPFFSATANMLHRLDKAGANGLVLFNRFYQPDVEIEHQKVEPSLNLSLSTEMRLPLRWVGLMYGRVQADLAITTGVHSHEDVVKGLMAGAAITMMASELLRNGISRIREIIFSLEAWLIEHDFNSVAEMQGLLSRERLEDATAYERANYLEVLKSYAPAYMWRSGALGLLKR